jgi:hypothetical protein
MRRRLRGLALVACVALAACNQSDFGDPELPTPPGETPDGPGDPAWGSEDVSCEEESDCAPNEDCIENICQMPRCTDGPYESSAPLGAQHYFFSDRELVAADDGQLEGGYWVDGYLPGGGTLSYPSGGGSYRMSDARLIDVAGGNVLGTRPERIVAAAEGRKSVVVNGSPSITLALSFVPVGVATGDLDHDSIDEIVAIGGGGQFAICHADEARCSGFSMSGVTGVDVAAGDVDGDGYDEAVFFLREGDKTKLMAFNLDHEESGEDQLYGLVIDTNYLAIDAGDIDGDGKAEVLALEDGGWAGFAKDHVHTWHLDNTTRLGSKDVDADSRDITVADVDMDGSDELLVLRDTKTVEVYQSTGPGQLGAIYAADLSVSSNPVAIAAADIDGDTPSARRISIDPELIATQPVPTMVLHFPPYSKTYSDGLPSLFVGSGDSYTEDFTDSVGLSAGVTVGIGSEFPGGLLGAEVSASLRSHVEASRTLGTTKVVGTRFLIEPNPEVHGDAYSVVVLAGACYNLYRYELEDPAGLIGSDGGELVLVVPVGGQSTVWSSNRYNALARALGTLPEVGPGMKLGDPTAYPSAPATSAGEAVRPDDMLFPVTPSFLVSDVGRTGWWLSVNETETNAVNMNTELSVASSIKVGGVKFGGEIGVSWGSGVALTVGHEALFGGMVPAIFDDPETPEDEYQAHTFTYRPFVYNQRYTDADGQEAGYYVLNFATGK